MSSSITEVSVHEGKLLVHIAENGHSYELDCNETTPVEAVMRYIESVSGISFSEQLVLCLDMKLESQRPLSAYKLPSSDREVFIFNRARLQNTSLPPEPERIDILEVADPSSPGCPHDPHPLDDALDPALKALPSYERQFRYHYHRGHAIYSRTHAEYAHCERFLREQKVQERAVDVARGNLDQYYRMISQNYSDFMKRYTLQYRIHSELLTNYKRDLEKLRSVKVHPALQSTSRSCLVDFVKEENLRKAVENCSNSHRQFEKKVSEFKQMFGEVKRKVEELFACRASFPIKNLELTIREHQKFINEQKSIMQSLSKDVNTVKKLVDECLSSQLSSSLRPHDAVSALGPMYDVHDKNHLPKMESCGRSITKLLEFCKDKKNEMTVFVHNYMQKITYVSYVIKDAKLQFPVFREAMVRQGDLFIDLKLVRGIGPAYRACLAEVVRRRASMKLYMGMAGQLAERLATKRDVEVRRREEFLKAHSLYIPRDVLAAMGLYDTPSQCDVNIAPFDANLLDIDISDLDRYAPEHLAGLPLKSEKHASLKGSFSMSNDSSHSAEGEEIVVDSLDKDDSDLLEGCELVEIAGTSKMEVENAKLKAELASAKAIICSLSLEVEYESLDDSKVESLLRDAAEKTAEALQLKDEYGKHIQSMLKAKQLQCLSYEKRIQELEQRLSDQYLQGQKLSSSNVESDFDNPSVKSNICKPTQNDGEAIVPYISTSEPMDEVSCISNSMDLKLGLLTRQPSKGRDGVDENMMDSSGMLNTQLDSLMTEPHREELEVSDKEGKDKLVAQLGMSLASSSTAESMPEPQNILASDTADEPKTSDDLLELQRELDEKSNQLGDTEKKLKAAVEDVAVLTGELEMSRKLLDESQMNCAHLENCLHEAREEAQTHLCAADRRASEYSALRASAVKMRGLFERLKTCVYAPVGVAAFADSLRALAQSLGTTTNDNEDDSTAEFRKCIRALAEKVSFLSRHRQELLDKNPKLEAANEQLRKDLEEKKELVTTLYKKHQLEKQANKERISFNRLEIHEIAAFVLNGTGHYEAINRNSFNYYLSTESVALFTDHLPSRPRYIVGQIVHIERQTVKTSPPTSARAEHSRANPVDQLTSDTETDQLTLNLGSISNPYNLPIGCEYFVVTVAMLPDTSIRSPPTS
ncbi:autophagy-related protein 11 isoform X1 [Mercurialis annua]|uniref:autophagy-related protein 11 isoform X1 n=1 Tax=Mercurialis annua TaxID=3986 RepID=UPI002160E23A|nr:autophagy-related protein 11 isoform X1 [Mercurialis annua]XP_050235311.1 autophagy-related protein 11 isoform X1 [Mercurialis annua]XP_050235319.1 autophagy-related protein 11 isoform X2 [Mercurialis annua]XP_050235327.1 autophagy-related protein 11 isoform X1 [Mercurialis annua]XP_050235342.1 autophagy-related protein 11 isoform X1 [Mercurialis annua]